ncbi:MAG: hydrogenase expression/formation protein HypE [Elusimicrobiota bacterium]|jgi:hydrogenase expression/formation protein HypE|nr:hydrogenase expression/formation protein HypE [Elusimicrobiota bacterium]
MKEISVAHGAGGEQSRHLINNLILKYFGNPILNELEDAAVLNTLGKIAFTTDSFVVDPIFFPGGNIGDLAICGTVNDLAVKGAEPKYISVSFIIEEGFAIKDFKAILSSMRQRASEAGVIIATGDTKVTPRGKTDKIFINTAGIGFLPKNANVAAKNIKNGDVLIVSGNLGDHSIAIMNARHNLGIKSNIKTDSAPLNKITQELIKTLGKDIKAMRDITRGGLASVLNEMTSPQIGFVVEEAKIPSSKSAAAAARLLGLDLLEMANEGKFLCVVSAAKAKQALQIIKKNKYGKNAEIIGLASKEVRGKVRLKTRLGPLRSLNAPLGELLPRIC